MDNFEILQQVIVKAYLIGITYRQMADVLECMPGTLERYIAGTSKPMKNTCTAMISIIEDMIALQESLSK